MGREGGAQETELAPATGTGPWLTKVRKTIDGTCHENPVGERADLRRGEVPGARLPAVGQLEPTPAHERGVCVRHGIVLVPEPDLPVLQLLEPRDHHRAGQPLRRALDALYLLVLCGNHAGLPRIRPVRLDRSLLLLRRLRVAHDDLRRFDVDAAFERHQRVAVFLQLPKPCRR